MNYVRTGLSDFQDSWKASGSFVQLVRTFTATPAATTIVSKRFLMAGKLAV